MGGSTTGDGGRAWMAFSQREGGLGKSAPEVHAVNLWPDVAAGTPLPKAVWNGDQWAKGITQLVSARVEELMRELVRCVRRPCWLLGEGVAPPNMIHLPPGKPL